MARKHTYRKANVERIDLERVIDELKTQKSCVVAVDAAKEDFVASIAGSDGHISCYISFSHPRQTTRFLGLLEVIRAHSIEPRVVLEPTGTYGDPLRYQCQQRKIAVFQMSTKRMKDASGVFDNVPSQHDAKACMVMTQLHIQ